MEINENSIYNAFGINPEQDAGTGEAAGAAETAQESTASAAAEESGNIEQEAADNSNAGEMSADERRQNAARRRQQEQQAAIDKAVGEALERERATAKARQDQFFAKAKLKNTITNQPITSYEDFDAWETAYNEQRLQQNLRAGKLTKENIDAVIEANPSVKAAKEIVQQKAELEQQQKNAAAQAKIAEELAEIGKIDPNIKTAADLLNMPNAKEFYGYVQKGLSFLDAYTLVNKDAVINAAAEAARTSALNNQRGKDHLSATANSRGAGAMSVPADELKMFKLFNPKATPAEIQAYFNKYKS